MRRPSPACGAAVGLQVPETAPLSPSVSARDAKRSIVAGTPGQSILRLFLPRVVGAFLLGALYARARYGTPATGGLVGASCAASFVLLERFVLRRNSGGFIRPLPFLIYFALRSVLYVGMIVIVIAVVNEAAGAGFGESGPSTSSFRWFWRWARFSCSASTTSSAPAYYSLSPPGAITTPGSRSARSCS